jgi:hypothetical protein
MKGKYQGYMKDKHNIDDQVGHSIYSTVVFWYSY